MRAELNRALRGGLTDYEWTVLVDDGHVDEVLVYGSRTVADLATKVRHWRSETRKLKHTAPRPADPRPTSDSVAIGARDRAVEALLASDATKYPEVKAFRSESLADRLLDPEEAREWIETYAAGEGPATWFAEVEFIDQATRDLFPEVAGSLGVTSDHYRPADPPPLTTRSRVRNVFVRWIEYPSVEDGWIDRRAIRVGGKLDRLWHLCDRLARAYGWEPYEAAWFVLTGVPPAYVSMRETVVDRQDGEWGRGLKPDADGAFFRSRVPEVARRRIVLDADPKLQPKVVASRYRQLRTPLAAQRERPLDEATYELVAFTERNTTGTWEERMKLWNATHSESPYHDVRWFRRKANRAREQILRTVPVPSANLVNGR